MIASLLSGLDTDLQGFKDQILASEILPIAANAYSRLMHSSLAQSSQGSSIAPPSEFFALVLSGGGHGSRFRGSRGGRDSRGSY